MQRSAPAAVSQQYGAARMTIRRAARELREKLPETRAYRAESYEAMHRERLEKCRASEARAQKSLTSANDRVAGAPADRLVTAAEMGCSRDCPAQQLGRDPQVV